ncbi:YbaK/EbsC family protein [Lipingzhangella sp. LS1_29]|uniref:YbaK/EbsC family protein n=1 Tax=Lipingzhangella rawalii TaxID=2055835 RepID=A0ABU2HB15_9ACTN|nr:YbaK/EbsC family protein [Lipingzhangella rawalii]MDS1272025.1 YbaK/EbsC family protein [Lipingzhangella rawalii]
MDAPGAIRMWGLWTYPASERADLLARPVRAALEAARGTSTWAQQARVAEIDPELADTASCCAAYGVPAEASANCVVVVGKRGAQLSMAACVVLATTRADVNGAVRGWLGARKASFASQDDVLARSEMAYGGITPIGLPAQWPILVDSAVLDQEHVILGSGIRGSKLVVPGAALEGLPGAEVRSGVARPISTDSDASPGPVR